MYVLNHFFLQVSRAFQSNWKALPVIFNKCLKKENIRTAVSSYCIASKLLWMSRLQSKQYLGIPSIKDIISVHKAVHKKCGNKMSKPYLKRSSSNLRWLLSGCCFSKKSKNESIVNEDSFVSSDRVCETIEESADNNLLISEQTDNLISTEGAVLLDDEVIVKNISVEFPSNFEAKQPGPTDEKQCLITESETIQVHAKGIPGGSGKPRVNYFVAVQVDNPEIRNALQNVQDVIVEKKPIMKDALISLSSLHITFVVMYIGNQEDLERAKAALVESYNTIKEDLEQNPLYLTFEGLSTFKNKVLYADIKMDEGHRRIYSMYKTIASCFVSQGFGDIKEKGGFTAHLTVAKLSKSPKLYKKGLKVISPAWYEDFRMEIFGVQRVNSLQLLRMDGPKDDKGYYQCHKECFFHLPTAVPEKPLKQMLEKSLERKKDMRQKINELTVKKLSEK